jgi:tetratricopeptide (TPR) repeat protein
MRTVGNLVWLILAWFVASTPALSQAPAAEPIPVPSVDSKNYFDFGHVNSSDKSSFLLIPVPETKENLTGDPRADKLIRSANDAMHRRDEASAKELLDQAKKVAPEQLGLWGTYGILAAHQKSYSEALEDLQKELKFHPDQTHLYPLVEGLQTKLGQNDALLETYRAWAATKTTNPYAVTQYMEILIDKGDPLSAFEAGKDAGSYLPDRAKQNGQFLMAMAQALMISGDNRGKNALYGILGELSYVSLNNTASDLADASRDLPLAELCARAALDELTHESKTWTLEGDSSKEEDKSRDVVNVWDTLGWTLFKEGKPEEARSLLQAAWLNRPSVEMGKHFGEFLSATGNKIAALSTYQIAVATMPPYGSLDALTDTASQLKDIEDREHALLSEGVQPANADPNAALASLKTLLLKNTGGQIGEAEYKLQLKNAKVVRFAPVDRKAVSGDESILAQVSLPDLFPDDSEVTLIRNARLSCHATTCELSLEP